MQTLTIDLNSDMGEGFGAHRAGDDEALLDAVTSANICIHGGSPEAVATARLVRQILEGAVIKIASFVPTGSRR
jgi:UPF0271 protein